MALVRPRDTVASRSCRLLLSLLLALACAAASPAHRLDGANTHVSFDIERLGLRWFSVEFRELQGEFAPAPNGQGAHLTVVVQTASVDARSTYWNERLRSAQWLDTARFPEMVFRSTSIRLEGDSQATVQGELTLHGVTRPLTLVISDIDCPRPAPAACRFRGRATLRRSEFGIPHGFWVGGDRVQILVRGE
jgi:polyisoprenoid-binding protein YceI